MKWTSAKLTQRKLLTTSSQLYLFDLECILRTIFLDSIHNKCNNTYFVVISCVPFHAGPIYTGMLLFFYRARENINSLAVILAVRYPSTPPPYGPPIYRPIHHEPALNEPELTIHSKCVSSAAYPYTLLLSGAESALSADSKWVGECGEEACGVH